MDWIPGSRLDAAREVEGAAEGDARAKVRAKVCAKVCAKVRAKVRVGVLALQGDVLEHVQAVTDAGGTPVPVRDAGDLADVDALIIPGGESTTIGKLSSLTGLLEPITEAVRAGLPTLGTCAGLILLSDRLIPPSDAPRIGGLDVGTVRNAYGRQLDSFEADLRLAAPDQDIGPTIRGVFIRAPRVTEVGDRVDVLAEFEGDPVAVQQGSIIATTFHPEMSGDSSLHQRLIALAVERADLSRVG